MICLVTWYRQLFPSVNSLPSMVDGLHNWAFGNIGLIPKLLEKLPHRFPQLSLFLRIIVAKQNCLFFCLTAPHRNRLHGMIYQHKPSSLQIGPLKVHPRSRLLYTILGCLLQVPGVLCTLAFSFTHLNSLSSFP